MVNQRPERMSLQVVAALCDIFECTSCGSADHHSCGRPVLARPGLVPRRTSSRSTAASGPAARTSSTSRDAGVVDGSEAGRTLPSLHRAWPPSHHEHPRGSLCALRPEHPPPRSSTGRRADSATSAHFAAIHTRGTCPERLQDRLLPGPPNVDGQPICSTCAEIPCDFHCELCDVEAGHHRGRLCARCALRDDLHGLLGGEPSAPALVGLVDALCASDRPESIIVWKRSPRVQALLRGLGDGTIPVTHEGLDAVPRQAYRAPAGPASASRPGPPARPLSPALRAVDFRQARRTSRRSAPAGAALRDLAPPAPYPRQGSSRSRDPGAGPLGQTGDHRNGQVPALAVRDLSTHCRDVHPAGCR